MALSLISDSAAIGVYLTEAEAESAVRQLLDADVSVEDISVVGGPRKTRAALMGEYVPPDFVKQSIIAEEERQGAMEGGALGLLLGFGSLLLPGVGALVILGPLVGMVGGAGIGAGFANVAGGLSFYSIAADYRKQLAAGHFLVIVHSNSGNEVTVKRILGTVSETAHTRRQPAITTRP